MLCELRSDASLAPCQNKPAKHPVVLALRDAIHDPAVQAGGGLVEDHFMRIIDARVSTCPLLVQPHSLTEPSQ